MSFLNILLMWHEQTSELLLLPSPYLVYSISLIGFKSVSVLAIKLFLGLLFKYCKLRYRQSFNENIE